jgi:hypothetical protein
VGFARKVLPVRKVPRLLEKRRIRFTRLIEIAKNSLKNSGGQLTVTKDSIKTSLEHLRSVKSWPEAVLFNDLIRN